VDETAFLRAHVERFLEDFWEVHRVEVDKDGDYPFRVGTAACWVHVEPSVADGIPPTVQVFAHAATGINKPTLRFWRELNELNREGQWTRVCLDGGTVVVQRTLDMYGSDSDSMERAIRAVAGVAQDIGEMLAAVYGGVTPWPPETETAHGH
jgi:hypothetical protein